MSVEFLQIISNVWSWITKRFLTLSPCSIAIKSLSDPNLRDRQAAVRTMYNATLKPQKMVGRRPSKVRLAFIKLANRISIVDNSLKIEIVQSCSYFKQMYYVLIWNKFGNSIRSEVKNRGGTSRFFRAEPSRSQKNFESSRVELAC